MSTLRFDGDVVIVTGAGGGATHWSSPGEARVWW